MDKNIREQIDLINQKAKEPNALHHLAAYKSNISAGEATVWSVLLNCDKESSQQVKWIFQAEQKAMEETDLAEVMAYISMQSKVILDLAAKGSCVIVGLTDKEEN